MEAFGRKMFEIVGMIFGKQPENLRKSCGNGKNIQKLVEILLLVCIRKKSPVYV